MQAMRERGLGLRALCREAGLDPSFFSKVLAGKRSPPAEETDLRKLAAALGVDAPLLIVSAGRIPMEWERLRADEGLFRAIHAMATGGRRFGPGRKTRPEPPAQPAAPSSFGEELL